MVTGSLLGLSVGNGVLEITHAFPFPENNNSRSNNRDDRNNDKQDDDGEAAGLEGHEFQLEMMRMLREVNVDNNCVGWYQSMYLGIYSTSSLLENQLSYQTDLSPNAVVVLYDPMQTSHGNLVLKCYRLTDECVALKSAGKNAYIDPKNIFEEVPVHLINPGLARTLLADVQVGGGLMASSAAAGAEASTSIDTTFDRLDLSTNPYLEKHLEFLSGWVDDLASEQHKFQYYTRQLARGGANPAETTNPKDRKPKKGEKKEEGTTGEGWASSDAPRRMESLLITNQIRSYCDQMDKFAGSGLGKLFLVGGLHKEERAAGAN
jgi:translation initiation factor 3 subunit H